MPTSSTSKPTEDNSSRKDSFITDKTRHQEPHLSYEEDDDDDDDDDDDETPPVARNASLMDASLLEGEESSQQENKSTSNSKNNSTSTSRKRRATDMTSSSTTATGSWEEFCRRSTRFKSLVQDALQKVETSINSTSTTNSINPTTTANLNDTSNAQDNPTTSTSTTEHQRGPRFSSTSVAAADRLATAQAQQLLQLQTQVATLQEEVARSSATNAELRKAAMEDRSRFTKMQEALQVSGKASDQARADADAAEATAATLASQLEAMQVVVAETKRASRLLYQEQEELSTAAAATERKYVLNQAELVKAQAACQSWQSKATSLERKAQQAQTQTQRLQTELDAQQEHVHQMNLKLQEAQQTEQRQKERLKRLTHDLKEAHTFQVNATETIAEAQSAVTTLEGTVAELTKANETLSTEKQQLQTKHAETVRTLQQSLQQEKSDKQALEMRNAEQQSVIERMHLEKQADAKRMEQMTKRIALLEKRVVVDGGGNTTSSSNNTLDTTTTKASTTSSSINKENAPNASAGTASATNKCSICGQTALAGLMKNCQCGRKCGCRAHLTCVNKISVGPSVSHPGTPAPRLPVVLCGNGIGKLATSSTGNGTGSSVITPPVGTATAATGNATKSN